MARSFVYIVSEDPTIVENVKNSNPGTEVGYFTYTPGQWRDGLDNPFFRSQLVNGIPALTTGASTVTTHGANNVVAFPQNNDNKVQKIEDMEQKAIESAIHKCNGNLTEAAKALGIGRATLYRKVRQFQIDPNQARRRRVVAA